MLPSTLRDLLDAVAAGSLSASEGEARLGGTVTLGHATVDVDRVRRTGLPEVVLGASKSAEQIVDILRALARPGEVAVVSRIDVEKAARVTDGLTGEAPDRELLYDPVSRVLQWRLRDRPALVGRIGVVCAGTSDLPVAEEAAVLVEAFGRRVERFRDVGVAGLHRLLARVDEIRACNVVIAVAGMEGALPGVLAGLVDVPVIAVPTSIGYGAAFGGVSALLTMLNSCASGLSVVNIDNGFGAAVQAVRIDRLATRGAP